MVRGKISGIIPIVCATIAMPACTRAPNGYFTEDPFIQSSLDITDVGVGPQPGELDPPSAPNATPDPEPSDEIPDSKPNDEPSNTPAKGGNKDGDSGKGGNGDKGGDKGGDGEEFASPNLPDAEGSCGGDAVRVDASLHCHGDGSTDPVLQSLHCNFNFSRGNAVILGSPSSGKRIKLEGAVNAWFAASYDLGSDCETLGEDSVLAKLQHLPTVHGQYHLRGKLSACVQKSVLEQPTEQPGRLKQDVKQQIARIFIALMAKSGSGSAIEGVVKKGDQGSKAGALLGGLQGEIEGVSPVYCVGKDDKKRAGAEKAPVLSNAPSRKR